MTTNYAIKPPVPALRGRAALHAATHHGARIYVLNERRGWVLGTLAIALQLAESGGSVLHYGVLEKTPPSRRCIGCWR